MSCDATTRTSIFSNRESRFYLSYTSRPTFLVADSAKQWDEQLGRSPWSRAILGNDAAIKAARNGKTNPWPDGAVLGKVVWKQTTEENWPTAIAPKEFVHAEFMFKDAKKWASTGGWGYARWKGAELKPYGNDASFAQECVGCHTPVKQRDYVFTTPALMPNMPD